MTNFQKVKKFMETFGQEVKSIPSLSSDKINMLRYNLIKEELMNLKDYMQIQESKKIKRNVNF